MAGGHKEKVTYELGMRDQEDLGSRKGMEGEGSSRRAKGTHVNPWAITPVTESDSGQPKPPSKQEFQPLQHHVPSILQVPRGIPGIASILA